jgi:predicted permease
VPALRASAPSLVADLRGGESAMAGAAGRRRFTLGEVLVAGQVALAVVLVVVASLLLRSFAATRATDLGFEARGVAIVSFDTEMVRYDAEQGRAFWRQALERVEAIPGVQAAALASPRVPLDVNFTTSEFQVEGRTYGEGERGEILNTVSVSPGYFDALRVPIVQGRLFAESDRPETPPVVIVSQEFVRRFWPEGGAIGRRVRLASAGRDYEVVGVVADYKVRTATERPTPYVHLAAWQRPSTYNYLIARSTGDADAMLVAMRRELLTLDPGLVFLANGTLERTFAASLLPARAGAVLATGFGALGALLAAIGLYGVMAFLVGRRTREIGIRLALGAGPRAVFRMILARAGVVAGAGALVGVLIAAGAARVLSGVLVGAGAADTMAWLAAVIVLGGVAAAASLVPAVRAMRVDPAKQLTGQ